MVIRRKQSTFWLWSVILLLTLMARPVALLAEPAQSESAPPLTAESVQAYFDAKLAQQMADDQIVGATVAVVQDGELLLWFLLLNINYAETLVYPVANVNLITRVWWIGVALTVALIVLCVQVWRRRP